MKVSRRATFNAAHRLFRPDWTDEKNVEIFGKCSNRNWHGHNFTLYVTVKGIPDENTGFVMNLKTLSQILKDKVIEPLDHKNLNLDVPFFKGKMASTEKNVRIVYSDITEDMKLRAIEFTLMQDKTKS